ncbi:DUF2634 domain-containing protein [Anaeromassilibacillus senegalensis]|uniref:DUF2634 domain-containing protein n=1 Tax=Anaeromassilibacillus senegalensis TaxID=1673717 RepID=UPI000680FD29|nr:DUF2634 domain-containing protein [Anaeromassilibacillus senegalensis]
MTLFPSLQPQAVTVTQDLPLYRETAWDYSENTPIFKGGSPVIVTGVEAVKVWAYKALSTPRYMYEMYSWDFGNEMESLIGQAYTEDLKRSEIPRFVRECLSVNPYITGVTDIAMTLQDDKLNGSCTIQTIYGGDTIRV